MKRRKRLPGLRRVPEEIGAVLAGVILFSWIALFMPWCWEQPSAQILDGRRVTNLIVPTNSFAIPPHNTFEIPPAYPTRPGGNIYLDTSGYYAGDNSYALVVWAGSAWHPVSVLAPDNSAAITPLVESETAPLAASPIPSLYIDTGLHALRVYAEGVWRTVVEW